MDRWSFQSERKDLQAIVTGLEELEKCYKERGINCQMNLHALRSDSTPQEIADTLSGCGYAAFTVKILKAMNINDILEIEDVWYTAYCIYENVWEYSKTSEKLTRDFAKAGLVELLICNFRHPSCLSNVQGQKQFHLVMTSLNILRNIAQYSDLKRHFKENKTAEVIMPFTKGQNEYIRVIAMLTMAYIVEENSKLIDETDIILNIVQWIDEAVSKSDDREYEGCKAWELTQGLIKLAVFEANKMKIFQSRSLPVFLKMLQYDDPKEQITAAKCIKILSFDKNVRRKIKEQEELVPALELLEKSEHSKVKKNAQDALRIIKGENDPTTSSNVSRTRPL